MGLLTEKQVLERFMDGGQDPRFLALVGAGWKFFAGSCGWVFAFRQSHEVTLIGADPMPSPAAPSADRAESHDRARAEDRAPTPDDAPVLAPTAGNSLAADLAEFCEAAHPEVLTFAAVSRATAAALSRAGFHKFRVGTEHRRLVPLSALTPPAAEAPVRDRRESDLRFEEWDPSDLDPGTPRRLALEAFHKDFDGDDMTEPRARWTPPGLFAPEAFLALAGMKRYFVLHMGDQPRALCVVTPIPGRHACWIRELLIGRDVSPDAVERLLAGVVRELGVSGVEHFWVPGACRLADGIAHVPATNPRHFDPATDPDGEPLYLAYRNQPGSGLWPHQALLIAARSVLGAAPPRLGFSPGEAVGVALRFLLRWPTTVGAALLVLVPFLVINRAGDFPAWALERAGVFRGGPATFAPLDWLSWWGRSILGQFLLPDRRALVTEALPLLGAIAWLERRRGSVIAPLALLASAALAPFIAQLALLAPLHYTHAELFGSGALATSSVDGEWMLSLLLGFAFGSGARAKGPLATAWILAIGVCGATLLACLGAPDQAALVLGLVPVPLFAFGFGVGASFGTLKTAAASLTLKETNPKDGHRPVCIPESSPPLSAPSFPSAEESGAPPRAS